MSKDLRHFLETLHTQAPELLARVPRQVSPRWELSAVQRRFEVDGRLPVIVFHHGLLRHGRALLQFFEPVFDNL